MVLKPHVKNIKSVSDDSFIQKCSMISKDLLQRTKNHIYRSASASTVFCVKYFIAPLYTLCISTIRACKRSVINCWTYVIMVFTNPLNKKRKNKTLRLFE